MSFPCCKAELEKSLEFEEPDKDAARSSTTAAGLFLRGMSYHTVINELLSFTAKSVRRGGPAQPGLLLARRMQMEPFRPALHTRYTMLSDIPQKTDFLTSPSSQTMQFSTFLHFPTLAICRTCRQHKAKYSGSCCVPRIPCLCCDSPTCCVPSA